MADRLNFCKKKLRENADAIVLSLTLINPYSTMSSFAKLPKLAPAQGSQSPGPVPKFNPAALNASILAFVSIFINQSIRFLIDFLCRQINHHLHFF